MAYSFQLRKFTGLPGKAGTQNPRKTGHYKDEEREVRAPIAQ